MNLVRLGHYHVPGTGNGYCQTALVVGVVADGEMPNSGAEAVVNLRVWDRDGDDVKRLDVEVRPPASNHATFHLSGDCPWHR